MKKISQYYKNMIKDLGLLENIGKAIQITLDFYDGHNVFDNTGKIVNVLIKYGSQHNTLTSPITTGFATNPYNQIVVNLPFGNFDAFKVDNSVIWAKLKPDSNLQDCLKDFEKIAKEIISIIETKNITRLGFLNIYETSQDNFEQNLVINNDICELSSTTLLVKNENSNNYKIRFIITQIQELKTRIEWDVANINKFESKELKKSLDKLIEDIESIDLLKFEKFVENATK